MSVSGDYMNVRCTYLGKPGTCCSHVLLIVAFILLMTVSCAVRIDTPYYQPSAIGGTNVRADRWAPRTYSVILFKHQGVIVGVNTYYKSMQRGHSTNKLYLDFSFEIPDGGVAQLVQHYIEVSASSKDSWESELSGKVWTGPGRTEEFPRDAPMIGKNEAWRWGTSRGYGNTKHAAFFFSALLFE